MRWYLQFPISYRDLELMLQDRGVSVDHTTTFRWIQAYATELEKRIRPHLRMSNGPWRSPRASRRSRWTQKSMPSGLTRGKELVGDFKNNGRELRPRGDPEPVRVHDFKIPELGKVAPYGVYDIAANHGWVSVGISADTGAFAVESIRRWWHKLGKLRYPKATRLTITADRGGSNGPQVKLWKRELQRLANETGLKITVAHLPPGTSKWNRIEHRLFAFITMNWRGKPLVSHQVIVQLIGATTTQRGLKVCREIDGNLYPKGVEVSDEEIQAINITRDIFHGEWNYTIAPNQQSPDALI